MDKILVVRIQETVTFHTNRPHNLVTNVKTSKSANNQSVARGGVAFIKGPNLNNKKSVKKNNNNYKTNKPNCEQAKGRTDLKMNTIVWVSLRQ